MIGGAVESDRIDNVVCNEYLINTLGCRQFARSVHSTRFTTCNTKTFPRQTGNGNIVREKSKKAHNIIIITLLIIAACYHNKIRGRCAFFRCNVNRERGFIYAFTI